MATRPDRGNMTETETRQYEAIDALDIEGMGLWPRQDLIATLVARHIAGCTPAAHPDQVSFKVRNPHPACGDKAWATITVKIERHD